MIFDQKLYNQNILKILKFKYKEYITENVEHIHDSSLADLIAIRYEKKTLCQFYMSLLRRGR